MTLALLAAWTIRASVVLGTALALSAALTRRSAALRHWVLAVGVVGALLTPAMTRLAPHWSIPVASSAAPAAPVSGAGEADVTVTLATVPAATTSPAGPAAGMVSGASGRFVERALLAAWVAGLVALALTLAIGLLRVAAIARRSTPLHDERWTAAALALQRVRPAVRNLRLLESNSAALLITWGFTPRVLLPRGARHWTDDRIAIVLSHETAHIVRRDWVVQMVAELLRCVLWFNPLAWIAVNRLRLESERACDDLVLAQGVEPCDYARHLVDVARSLSRSQVWTPLPAMARPSSLERRVSAMLDEQVSRRPLTRLARYAGAIPLLAMTLSVASFAAQSQFATVSGVVRDQLGGTIPRITLSLVNRENGAKHEIRSSDSGAFEFVGVPAGNYTLSTAAIGFKATDEALQIAAGQTVRRDVHLNVGTLQETLMIVDGPASPLQTRPASTPPDVIATCTTQPNSGGIKPPMKVRDVKPRYPGSMTGSGVDGRVEMQAVIATDGTVKTTQTVDATNPDFELAAQEAVRQWRFTPTLLNCVPIEVEMNVLVRFRPQDAVPPPPPPPPAPPRR